MKKLADEMIGANEGMYFHSALIDIICREKTVDRSTISKSVETDYMMAGQETMLAMHFVMNADYDRYNEVIDRYDKDYLGGSTITPRRCMLRTSFSRIGRAQSQGEEHETTGWDYHST